MRAKIALFSLAHQHDAVQKAATLRQYRNYANLAESYSAIPSRFLALTMGVSAVGKSSVALRLVEALGAIRLRSDVERKRLFGEQHEAQRGALQGGIYNAESSAATYERLNALAGDILRAGYPVVLDATFLKHAQRQDTGVPYLILDCQAPESVIAGWLAQRQAQGGDPSDATLEVVQAQQAGREALDADEQAHSKRVDTQDSASLDTLVGSIRQRLPGI